MTEAPSLQQRIHTELSKAGIPSKEIKVYGSQIMVTAWSYDAAKKWAQLLHKFCSTVRGPVESRDVTKDDSALRKANPGLAKARFYHEVWRIGGTI